MARDLELLGSHSRDGIHPKHDDVGVEGDSSLSKAVGHRGDVRLAELCEGHLALAWRELSSRAFEKAHRNSSHRSSPDRELVLTPQFVLICRQDADAEKTRLRELLA
jgi:hypothetical protein